MPPTSPDQHVPFDPRVHADRLHALEAWRDDAEKRLTAGKERFEELTKKVTENTAISQRAEANAASAATSSAATAAAVAKLDANLAGAKRFFGWLATGADLAKISGDVSSLITKLGSAGLIVWAIFKYVVKLAVLQ